MYGTLSVGLNARAVAKYSDFGPIEGYNNMLEMVQELVLWLCTSDSTLFLSTTETTTKSVWKAFENYVTVWLLFFFYCVALLYIVCLSLCLTALFGE